MYNYIPSSLVTSSTIYSAPMIMISAPDFLVGQKEGAQGLGGGKSTGTPTLPQVQLGQRFRMRGIGEKMDG